MTKSPAKKEEYGARGEQYWVWSEFQEHALGRIKETGPLTVLTNRKRMSRALVS